MKNSTKILLEHKLINQIARLSPNRSKDLILSIGDDASVFTTNHLNGKYMVACQDLLIEDVHFKLKTHSAEDLGHKSIAVNFSDIAAMGATPLFVMISIALPKKLRKSNWISSFYKSANKLCEKYNTTIMGGDLSSSPSQLFIDVSVIGICAKKPILRNGAKLGDLIGVTGPLGLSHTGLRILNGSTPVNSKKNSLSKSELKSKNQIRDKSKAITEVNNRNLYISSEFKAAINCHRRPQPRIEEAKKLSPFINSLMDISDGLVNDLNIILNKSSICSKTKLKLGAELNFEQISCIHPETINFCQKQNELIRTFNSKKNRKSNSNILNPIDFALYGGEDFELLFTFNKKYLNKIVKALEHTPWSVLGEVSDSGKISYLQNGKLHKINLNKRWSHF
jgi:thiamine-monophosphate kinase